MRIPNRGTVIVGAVVICNCNQVILRAILLIPTYNYHPKVQTLKGVEKKLHPQFQIDNDDPAYAVLFERVWKFDGISGLC